MFSQIPERQMHWVRWVLTCAWLLLTFSLFYDPFTPWLTHPDNPWSPLRLDPTVCIRVQGVCLPEQPYSLGAPLFWGLVVPAAIFILLVFGHELWRRICPLSFLSQLPGALKWQRQRKREDTKTGKIRYELVKIKKESWLGRNHLYFQFGWLFIGLCFRILFVNSDRLALALWLLFTIGFAITVGYLYGGKSWCQYFCPMAPVQKIYAEPGGLLTSAAHLDDRAITQSMCRTTSADGKEQSACVACKSPCIDIDSERSYWDGLNQPQQQVLYYGYFGLVVGYFLYYYLYAGNWDYYFSGAWAHQEDQLQTLLKPGFYLFNQPIPIPKLVAVPLTLGLFSALGYWGGIGFEKRYKARVRRKHEPLSNEQIRHRVFTFGTFIIFNIFFIFGARPFIILLPHWLQYLYDFLIISLSTFWILRTWNRSPDLYSLESLASRLRKQLVKLKLDVSRYLDGRSLDDLNFHEVYVLAKVLPGFTREKRHQAYKGVLRESLEEGYVDTISSLEVLRQLRSELDISDEEHQEVLEELGVEDPDLLDPNRLHTRENLVRLTGYRKALERMLVLQQRQATGEMGASTNRSFADLLQSDPIALQNLRREYSISLQDEEDVLAELNQAAGLMRRAEFLLARLANLVDRDRTLNQPLLRPHQMTLTPLRATLLQKKRLLVVGLLEDLEQLDRLAQLDEAVQLAQQLGQIAPAELQELLNNPDERWTVRLHENIIAPLRQPDALAPACALDLEPTAIVAHLDDLLAEGNPVVQSICLYLLYQLDEARGVQQAAQLLQTPLLPKSIIHETATLLSSSPPPAKTLSAFSALEKLVYLSNSDFFSGSSSDMLIELTNRADIKPYRAGEVVTEEGDTCRELLLLIEGIAEITIQSDRGEAILQSLRPGQILDELEVLCHGSQTGTITAQATPTRILAVPVDDLDDLLDRDHDFARRILEMESRRLQQFLYNAKLS